MEKAVWNEGTVYIRTMTSEGHEVFTEHRCWNVDVFVRRAHAVALDEGGKVERVTEADFRLATKRRH